jgi:hypothetical protein
MDEHLPGVSTRCDARSCPTAEYRQTTRRTTEYRLVGEGTAECRQPAGGLARGGAGSNRATRGEGGFCDKKVGFVCSLADRAGPSPLFSRPESPSAPQGAGDGLGSPDGLRPYSRGKRGTEDAAKPNNTVPMKKKGRRGPSSGRRLEMLLLLHLTCVQRNIAL